MPGWPDSSLRLFPEPITRRRGWERAAFAFFLLGVGCVPGIGVANICLGTALFCTVAWRLSARARGEDFLGPFRRTTPLHAPIGAFVLLSILSCAFSTLPSRSFIQIKGFGTFLLVVFIAALLDDEDDVRLVIDAWRTTALYLVLRGLVEWAAGADNLDLRVTGGLSVYMTYAGLLLVFVPLLGARALSGGRRSARIADGIVAAAGAFAIALTLTRSAYLGLAIGLLVVLLAARPRLALAAPFGVALFVVLMPLAVRDRLMSATNPKDVTMNDRVAMWKAGAAMIRERPLFGVGPARVKALYPAYRVSGFVEPRPGHLHNNVVMIAAETGIPSLLAYLWFVGAFFVAALRQVGASARGVPLRGVTLGAIGAMASLFAAGMFEYNFGDVEVLMATLVVAALPFAGRARPAAAD
jgi:putative inorganic carbon (HCO3(-)) transporter